MMIRRLFHTLAILLPALLAAGGTVADDDDHDKRPDQLREQRGEQRHRHDHDHDRARAAREAGAIVPLNRILDTVSAQFDGVLLEVELEDEHPKSEGWVYEVKLRTPQGAVVKLFYDAHAGTLVGTRGRGVDAARRPQP